MGYSEAMQAAGAKVLLFEYFGSYQGDWWAKVSYEGRTYWVHGSYGSCSGCDAFCAEFDFDGDDSGCDNHRYGKQDNCEDCKERSANYQRRLEEFGRKYLVGGEMTQEEAEKHAAANIEWDSDAPAMLEFIKRNA